MLGLVRGTADKLIEVEISLEQDASYISSYPCKLIEKVLEKLSQFRILNSLLNIKILEEKEANEKICNEQHDQKIRQLQKTIENLRKTIKSHENNHNSQTQEHKGKLHSSEKITRNITSQTTSEHNINLKAEIKHLQDALNTSHKDSLQLKQDLEDLRGIQQLSIQEIFSLEQQLKSEQEIILKQDENLKVEQEKSLKLFNQVQSLQDEHQQLLRGKKTKNKMIQTTFNDKIEKQQNELKTLLQTNKEYIEKQKEQHQLEIQLKNELITQVEKQHAIDSLKLKTEQEKIQELNEQLRILQDHNQLLLRSKKTKNKIIQTVSTDNDAENLLIELKQLKQCLDTNDSYKENLKQIDTKITSLDTLKHEFQQSIDSLNILISQLKEENAQKVSLQSTLESQKTLYSNQSEQTTSESQVMDSSSNSFSGSTGTSPKKYILLLNVPQSISREDLQQELSVLGPDNFAIVKPILAKTPNRFHWQLSTTPQTEHVILSRKFLKIMQYKLRAVKYIRTIRCSNCQSFNHLKFQCTSPPACAKCSLNHHTINCTSNSISCVNCINLPKSSLTPHTADSTTCPHYQEWKSFNVNNYYLNQVNDASSVYLPAPGLAPPLAYYLNNNALTPCFFPNTTVPLL